MTLLVVSRIATTPTSPPMILCSWDATRLGES